MIKCLEVCGVAWFYHRGRTANEGGVTIIVSRVQVSSLLVMAMKYLLEDRKKKELKRVVQG